MKPRRRKWWIAVLAGIVLLAVSLWIWDRVAVLQESATPDHLDLGTVRAGSTVEISARFLTFPGRSPLERLHDRLRKAVPISWWPALSKIVPWNRRPPVALLPDLSVLKPEIEAPPFVRVTQVTPDQRARWYGGQPFFVLQLRVDTERPGEWSGEVRLRLDRRQAALPIRLTVRESLRTGPRLLIAQTPYQSDSTEDGSMFDTTAGLLADVGLSVDCRHTLPEDLDAYRTVLLAEAGLSELGEDGVARVREFVWDGGRLILTCNAFMSGTVSVANKILAGHGLQVVDQDYGQDVTVTNLAPDVLTEGVRRLEFFRPSLVRAVGSQKGRALALAPGGEGGLIAVSRLEKGGEIIVLGTSMWWNWIHKYEGQSDNVRMMRNLLRGEEEER